MWKFVITALVALEIVLLSSFLSPAEAVVSDTENYIWDYASVGSSEVVCKRVVFHPEARKLPPGELPALPAKLRSQIVDRKYCDGTPPLTRRG